MPWLTTGGQDRTGALKGPKSPAMAGAPKRLGTKVFWVPGPHTYTDRLTELCRPVIDLIRAIRLYE